MFCILIAAEKITLAFCLVTPNDLSLQMVRINVIKKQKSHSVLSNENHYAFEYKCRWQIWTCLGVRLQVNIVVSYWLKSKQIIGNTASIVFCIYIVNTLQKYWWHGSFLPYAVWLYNKNCSLSNEYHCNIEDKESG